MFEPRISLSDDWERDHRLSMSKAHGYHISITVCDKNLHFGHQPLYKETFNTIITLF
jgi:hypothetical protein